MAKCFAYIGNWKPVKGSGMAVCEFDTDTGRLKYLRNELEEMQIYIGCICIDKKRNVLYCTDERPDYPGLPGGGGGRLLSFAISPEDGSLTLLGSRPSYGAKPSYVTADEDFKYLLLTNHGGRSAVTGTDRDEFGNYYIKVYRDESSVVLFPLEEDGIAGAPADIFRLEGSGPKFFQQSAHAHSIVKAPGKNLYAVCDKGGDQLFMFKVDGEKQKIVPCAGTPCRRSPGSAPRYSTFHPVQPWFYINKESETIISAFQYDEEGKLEHLQTVSSLPEGYEPPPYDGLSQSDICVDREGRFLYDMLRIVNVINVYRIDEENGTLSLIQTVDTPDGGRAFTLSPDGRFLAVAFIDGQRIDVYEIGDEGKLGAVVSTVTQPKPSWISFF